MRHTNREAMVIHDQTFVTGLRREQVWLDAATSRRDLPVVSGRGCQSEELMRMNSFTDVRSSIAKSHTRLKHIAVCEHD